MEAPFLLGELPISVFLCVPHNTLYLSAHNLAPWIVQLQKRLGNAFHPIALKSGFKL